MGKNNKKKKSKPKKFYAIKEGIGVKDIIVRSWDECSKLVLGYNAVYKSFLPEDEAKKYLEIVDVGVASGKCGFHTLRAFSPLIPMVCRLFRYSKVYIVL